MHTFLEIIYVIVALVMSVVILLQSGKGGMGAIAGGSSTGSIFGGGGAGAFLNKLTAWLAVAFVILAMILVVSSSTKQSSLKGIKAPKKSVKTEKLVGGAEKKGTPLKTKDGKKPVKKENK